MKKRLFPLLALILLIACEKESTTDILSEQEIHDNRSFTLRGPAHKIDVCHLDNETGTWHLISISENAWAAHERHGDVQLVDQDGDGWVAAENECVPGGDCDDNNPAVYPGSGEVCTITSNATGKIWMDRNLGASHAATSSTDAASYGHLYQWGRGADGHQLRSSDMTSIQSSTDQPGHGDFITDATSPYDWRNPKNNNLWQGVNGVNNPCPNGFRLPTESEWRAEQITNAETAYNNLKLPMAGGRSTRDGSLGNVGTIGLYWSSSVSGVSSSFRLGFNSNIAGMCFCGLRADGRSVRCIKEE
jgi:uncharacterized protein (TIGR02145 family)